MTLVDLINKIAIVDRTLQKGANNIAHKANELIGLGNYQISNLMFGASATIMGSAAAYYIFLKHVPVAAAIYAGVTAFSIYQIRRNFKLEELERSNSEQDSGTIAIDYKLLQEKRAIAGFHPGPAKTLYLGMVIGNFTLLFTPLDPSVPQLLLGYDLALLVAQYFREADHLRPTARNHVFNFFGSIVPKLLRKSYDMPMSIEAQNAVQYASSPNNQIIEAKTPSVA